MDKSDLQLTSTLLCWLRYIIFPWGIVMWGMSVEGAVISSFCQPYQSSYDGMAICEYAKSRALSALCARVPTCLACPRACVPKFLRAQISACPNLCIACPISACPFFRVPKFPRAQISACPNIRVPKYPRAQISACPFFRVPKFSRAQISACPNFRVPKFSRAQIFACPNFRVPKFPRAQIFAYPNFYKFVKIMNFL